MNYNSFICGHLCLNCLHCMNQSLSLSGTNTSLFANYIPAFQVYEDSEIAWSLALQSYNSFTNINSNNNCITFKMYYPISEYNVYKPIEIDDGCLKSKMLKI